MKNTKAYKKCTGLIDLFCDVPKSKAASLEIRLGITGKIHFLYSEYQMNILKSVPDTKEAYKEFYRFEEIRKLNRNASFAVSDDYIMIAGEIKPVPFGFEKREFEDALLEYCTGKNIPAWRIRRDVNPTPEGVCIFSHL